MASLRVKKEINKPKSRKNQKPISLVKTLPNDLLVNNVAKVASRSMIDLCKIKLSCKEFLNASEDDYVYQHAAMDNRCRESGNLEIIYREGMVQYFSTLMVDLGLKNLKKTALEGHHEAKYVYSMLLMANCDDDEGRKLGFDLFDELKNSTGITIVGCRKRVKSVRTITMLYA
ncbi:F-box plant protein, putative [Medicago truncatula]|uniref:F-box plant protein, putative n=1 Tax=Medicago truncatula TaxID=3880 RepID=G7JPZ6_MEDTR|nr:F-box plant protein, putative [Medicago truncatula]